MIRCFHDPYRQPNKGKPDCFHPLSNPGSLKHQLLHSRVEVESEDHDLPPGGVFPKLRGRQLPSSQVFFHDGMSFFTLTAALMESVDQFIPFQVPVRYNAEDLVTFLLHPHGGKGQLDVPLHPRKFRLF